MRPCEHDHPSPIPDKCRVCWLYVNNEKYKAYYDSIPWKPYKEPDLSHIRFNGRQRGGDTLRPERCIHLGSRTEFRAGCGGWKCKHKCDKGHEYAIPGDNCQTCGDYELDSPDDSDMSFHTRHLAYHVYPVAGNGVWQSCLEQLKSRLHLFNGRRLITVTHGGGMRTDPPEMVDKFLDGHGCEIIHLENDKVLREVAAWPHLWGRLESFASRGHCALFAHAKGVTRPVNVGITCHPWSQMLHEINLDYWPVIEEHLKRHPITGAFKKRGNGFEHSKSAWHYSGTFYWVRLNDFFTRPWKQVDQFWWGTESWPGIAYRWEDAGCLFHEGKVNTLNMYLMNYLNTKVMPEYRKWTEENKEKRTSFPRLALA